MATVRAVALATLLAMSSHAAAAQRSLGAVRGRVTTDSGAPVSRATIVITAVPSAATRTATSDTAGNYSLELPEVAAEYVLTVSATGRRTIQRRLSLGTGAVGAIENVVLVRAMTELSAVRVTATRNRPYPSGRGGTGILGMGTSTVDKTPDGVAGAVPPELAGDFAAIAATLTGFTVTPEGVSAFGLAPENNVTTLNGLSAPIGALPRDASTSLQYSSSPWDPTGASGSGVRIASTLMSGSNISGRRVSTTQDQPALQFGDHVARATGQEFTNATVSGAADGPIRLAELFYNVSGQVNRSTSPSVSVLSADRETLLRNGVAPDSVFRFLDVVRGRGIPLTLSGFDAGRRSTSASFGARVDHAAPTGSDASPSWWISALATGSNSSNPVTTSMATPSFGSSSSSATGMLQGSYARYLGTDHVVLNETSSALTVSNTTSQPERVLPGASVLVASNIGDVGPTLGTLGFAGSGGVSQHSRQWSLEAINTTTRLYASKTSSPMKFYLQSRLEGYSESSGHSLGSFTFGSLADVAANRPSSFTRRLGTTDISGGAWSGAAALGLQGRWGNRYVMGGVRAEASRFTTRPGRDAQLEQAFGVRSDYAPHMLALSPRIGFEWFYKDRPSYTVFSPGLLTMIRSDPQIRGGVGLFMGSLQPTLLSPALASAVNRQTLVCVGEAAPTPDWQGYAANELTVPQSCSGAVNRIDTARTVTLFESGYKAPRRWSASLGWAATLLRTGISIDGTYAFMLNQPGRVDLNFLGVPRFRLADEGNREVFAAASDFSPANGLVTPLGSRRVASFGSVTSRVSDLRGEARQIAVSATPFIPHLPYLNIGYTWLDTRSQFRGFDGASGGDPRTVEWRDAAPSHTVLASLAKSTRMIGGTLSLRAVSGVPYTPVVAGDVNGDGLYGDRAFVFDPSVGGDTARRNGLARLLNGSEEARSCLVPQVGRIAAPVSCRGGWWATMSASLFLRPRGGIEQPSRFQAWVTVQNILGGLDQAIHGSDDLRGWGLAPRPDAVLYRMRGFDPVGLHPIYEVNPRFATFSPATTTMRSPMRATLVIKLDLGVPRAEQELEQNLRVQLPLVGTRAPVDSIKLRYLDRQRTGFIDLYGGLLKISDSLALSREQVAQFTRRDLLFRERADTVYHELAVFLAALPKKFEPRVPLTRIQTASDAMVALVRSEGPFIMSVLTPGQLALMSDSWRQRFNPVSQPPR